MDTQLTERETSTKRKTVLRKTAAKKLRKNTHEGSLRELRKSKITNNIKETYGK